MCREERNKMEENLFRNIKVKHKCGHSVSRKIGGYGNCVDMHGSIEKQIERKVEYFQGIDCVKCLCRR